MAVGTVDARLRKDKRGESVTTRSYPEILTSQLRAGSLFQSLIVWVKKLVFHLIPPSHREAGQLGLVPTRPLSQLGLGSTRPGQLGLFIFLMVNRDITYVPKKKFGRYDLEYVR